MVELLEMGLVILMEYLRVDLLVMVLEDQMVDQLEQQLDILLVQVLLELEQQYLMSVLM